jgi:hypothetical protein
MGIACLAGLAVPVSLCAVVTGPAARKGCAWPAPGRAMAGRAAARPPGSGRNNRRRRVPRAFPGVPGAKRLPVTADGGAKLTTLTTRSMSPEPDILRMVHDAPGEIATRISAAMAPSG